MNEMLKMYGAPWCPDCRRAKEFLGELRVKYDWINVDHDPEGLKYVEKINNGKQIIPTLLFPDGSVLVEPTNAELAEKLGIKPKAERQFYDVIIVGSGPAGLTAAIYTAREGLDTLVIERSGVGGQAGVTERIENYPGFPEGVGGAELADSLRDHAERFGVEVLPAQVVGDVAIADDYRVVTTESGDEYGANTVIIACGTRYRRLNVPGEEDLIGAGVHFCATCDGPFYKGEELVVVGGGNSGVEESIFLTKFAKRVTVLERSNRLKASQLLKDKAAANDKIEIRLESVVQELQGNGRLNGIVVRNTGTGSTETLRPAGAFIFIGLDPNTDFLKGKLDLDDYGFIRTSKTLETSMPGVFAAGDARAGSTKQVASAVGEGATCALMVRQYLQELEA